jgi:hypothetical protein
MKSRSLRRGTRLYHASEQILDTKTMVSSYANDNPDNKDRKPGIIFFSRYNYTLRTDSTRTILNEYKTNNTVDLINLGNNDTRLEINRRIQASSIFDVDEKSHIAKCTYDVDIQIGGGKANYKYHSILKRMFGRNYMGTIIDYTRKVTKNNDIDDLEGFEETVIWKSHSKNLTWLRSRS